MKRPGNGDADAPASRGKSMRSSSNSTMNLSSLVIVAILFGALLLPVATRVDATPAPGAPSMHVVTGPFFVDPKLPYQEQGTTPFVKARPNHTLLQQKVIRVTSNIPVVGASLSSLTFKYQLEARPGSFDAPAFPKALQWEASCSSASGWHASVDNSSVSEGIRTLTFSGNSMNADGVPPGVDFTICFRIPDNATGSDPDPAKNDSYPVQIVAVVGGPASIAGTTDTTPSISFRIDIDSIAPHATGAYTKDFNGDGHLDGMQVFFDEAMEPNTLNKDQFVVRARDQSAPYSQFPPVKPTGLAQVCSNPTGFAPWPPLNSVNYSLCDYKSPRGENQTVLSLASAGRFDTGVKPDVYYPASKDNAANSAAANYTDLAGNRLVPFGRADLNEVDDAKPVLVSTYGIKDSTKVIATFSENVTSGTARPDVPALPTGSLVLSDFEWRTAGTPMVPHVAAAPICRNSAAEYTGVWTNSALAERDVTDGVIPDTTHVSSATAAFSIADNGLPIFGPGIKAGTTMSFVSATSVALSQPATVSPGPLTISIRFNQWASVDHKPTTSGNHASLVLKTPFKLCDGDHTGPNPILDDIANIAETLHLAQPSVRPCPPPLEYFPCGSNVVDANGLTAVDGAGLKIDSPHVDSTEGAEIQTGTSSLLLTFNGPVSNAGNDNLGIQIGDIDVVSADGTGQGPSGIVQIFHVAGNPQARIILDHAVRPTDVDDTPAKIRIRCHNGNTGIKGTGLDAFIPCYDPDLDGYADVNMVDLTPPSIMANGAQTYDGNHNGYIDGYKLTFSEPIDDASFCYNKALSRVLNPCNPYNATSNPDGVLSFDSGASTIRGPYTWDTDAASNDNEGIIKFPDNQKTSDALPRIFTTGIGLFTDQAYRTVTSPAYLGAVPMNQICTSASNPPNPVPCNLSHDTVTETDGAPPVIWSAKTVDTHREDTLDPNHKVILPEGNGLIDGYRVRFSEAVFDNTFHASEWHVAGHTVLSKDTADLGVDASAAGKFDDNEIIVRFSEGTVPDTAAKPELTYSPVLGGMKDRNGQAMVPVVPNTVVEKDNAPPTIYSVIGFRNQDKVTVHFSEPVDNGNKGALSRTNFIYSNLNYATDTTGASGLADQNAVQNVVASDQAVLTLNAPLSRSDLNKDCISAQLNGIKEIAPSVTDKLPVGLICHLIGSGIDTTPPANVTGLGVDVPLLTANAATLVWTAPGNDGLLNGNVTGYKIKVSKSSITPATFDVVPAAGTGEVLASSKAADLTQSPHVVDTAEGITFTFNPEVGGLALPGELQRVAIVGLKAETAYHIAVEAYDNATPAANVGGMGREITFVTLKDTTPPVGQLIISSSTHHAGQATASAKAVFTWTNMTDPESTVQYKVAFNEDPGYLVTDKDTGVSATTFTKSAIPTGTHTFHVAAFSAGGESVTAHYTIVVGYATIDPVEIEASNSLINFTATRLHGVNSVDWALPSQSDLPLGSTLEGVRVYRFDGTQLVVAADIKGDYASLATGHYDDNSTAANSRSAYRVDMVFANGQTQPGTITGVLRVEDITPPNFLVPLLITLAAIAVIGGVVGYVLYRRKNRAAFDESGPASTDPETGVPTHDVKCPSCQTPFQALGALPLHITCPNCSVSGILQ